MQAQAAQLAKEVQRGGDSHPAIISITGHLQAGQPSQWGQPAAQRRQRQVVGAERQLPQAAGQSDGSCRNAGRELLPFLEQSQLFQALRCRNLQPQLAHLANCPPRQPLQQGP